jgi:ketosteroid isomerase-like protein
VTETEQRNLALVRDYLAALERGAAGDDLAPFFTPDAVQVEFPNRLNPHGGQSDLEALLRRSEQGRHLLSSQRYEVRHALAQGEHVAVEAYWTGTLAVPLGPLAAGDAMRAHFAMFFACRDGRIVRQHNYDCFEPW